MFDFAKSFLIKITQPRPRYGWSPAVRSFQIGARVRFGIANVRRYNGLGKPMLLVSTGELGTIIGGDGLPSSAFNSKGKPVWEVQWDNGSVGDFFEWALELV